MSPFRSTVFVSVLFILLLSISAPAASQENAEEPPDSATQENTQEPPVSVMPPAWIANLLGVYWLILNEQPRMHDL